MRTERAAGVVCAVIAAGVVLLVASCGRSKSGDAAEDFYEARNPYLLRQVEQTFQAAHVSLLPELTGDFRVGNKDPHGCELLNSRDGRTVVTVCRERWGPLPIMVIPQGRWKEFHDAHALIKAIDRGRLKGATAYLHVMVEPNVNIGYTGRDRRRVAQIAQAVDDLKAHKPS